MSVLLRLAFNFYKSTDYKSRFELNQNQLLKNETKKPVN